MIPFLNRNDAKWPHQMKTRQMKIFGRNHILPPLGIEKTLIMQSYNQFKSNASLLPKVFVS
jgi:hypothetical protein